MDAEVSPGEDRGPAGSVINDPRIGAPIQWRVHLRSNPERVHQFLASAAGRALFWAEEAVEINGHIHFRFIDGTVHIAPIVRDEPPTLFELDYLGGRATFHIQAAGDGGTDLTLTHAGVPAAEWLDCYAGWANVLLPLVAQADHGVDLRNHDPTRTWAEGYLNQ